MTQLTPVEALCNNAIRTQFAHLSAETCQQAKLRILDVIGCAIGGAEDQGNPQLAKLIEQWSGKDEATVLFHGFKAPAHQAALVNSTMARSFDFEALGPLVEGKSIPGHTSGTTVISALAMSEAQNADGKSLIAALLAGDDVVCRILAATGHGGLPPGWDIVGTVNAFGSTTIAARLLELNDTELRHAFGIAVNQMAGTMLNIWDGSPVFKLLQGFSSQNGILSAQLAQAGWTGPDDPLLGENGYYGLYTNGCKNPEMLTYKLGQQYYHDAHFKQYPCCAVSHSAIDCALKLVIEHDIQPKDISKIELFVTQGGLNSFLNQPITIKDHPHTSVLFNYRYHVASAILRKSILPEHFSEDAIRDASIQPLADKISLSLLPEEGADLLSAGLKIFMKNGSNFEEKTFFPSGEPLHHPLAQEKIINKFYQNIEFAGGIPQVRAEEAVEMILALESIDNLSPLIEKLIKS